MGDLAAIKDVELAWRPLTAVEKPRAEYYLGVASRRIRRRWPDVDARLATTALDPEDVSDVVVQMVLSAVDVPPVRGAKSFSEAVGPMSRSATLQPGKTDLLAFEDWMITVFEPAAVVQPLSSMPPSGRYEGIFEWQEGAY